MGLNISSFRWSSSGVQSFNMREKNFIKCEKCGKNLIVQVGNGEYHLRFGRIKDRDGRVIMESNSNQPKPSLELIIHGSVSIRCFAKDCDHWTELHPTFQQS